MTNKNFITSSVKGFLFIYLLHYFGLLIKATKNQKLLLNLVYFGQQATTTWPKLLVFFLGKTSNYVMLDVSKNIYYWKCCCFFRFRFHFVLYEFPVVAGVNQKRIFKGLKSKIS